MRFVTVILISMTGAGSASALAANQVLVLSGGGSPASNHYSQFLQTRSVFRHLKGRLTDPVDVYFGAGNQPGVTAAMADVHKTEHDEEGDYERYLVGEIEGNHAATKTNVREYFQNRLRSPLDTFFLVVSDHGMPNEKSAEPDGRYSNNCIDLWSAGVENGSVIETGSFQDARCLSKNELRDLLATNLKAKRTVFAMSQCFSGGFHQMSVDEKNGYPKANPAVCGFTAVTHDTWASGCSPDVDGPTYQGYERSFTEQLTGFDYVREKKLRSPRASFAEAHEAALLEDLAVDIPLATSDYFLWRWALRLQDPKFIARNHGDVARAREAFTRAANFQLDLKSPAFTARKKLFLRMKEVILARSPELRPAIGLPVEALAANLNAISSQMTQLESDFERYDAEADKLYEQYAFELWLRQYERGSTLALTAEEYEIEAMILKSRGTLTPVEKLTPVLWARDPAKAERVAQYLADRETRILDYALTNGDLTSASRLRRLDELDAVTQDLGDELDYLAKEHGLSRRMLIYRQVLGAWAALEALGDQEALAELSGLLECERTRL
jgi:hypothetical protein